MAAIDTGGFEIVNHQPFSPDLIPNYFYFITNLKDLLRGPIFESYNGVVSAIQAYFNSKKNRVN